MVFVVRQLLLSRSPRYAVGSPAQVVAGKLARMDDRKQINFTIVPDDKGDTPRVYANFCAISHTPFDFTLSFCEVLPLSENDIQQAQTTHVVRAPVRAKIAVPIQVLPNLIAALQEHMRVFSESTGASWDKGPVH
jgi:Protein of unknown function (DUF3467)